MKNNKLIKRNILKIIDNLYRLTGKTELPDVKNICTEAKIDRQTAVKFLYTWWERKQLNNSHEVERLSSLAAIHTSEPTENQMALTANNALQSLAKEIELYSDVLNNLPGSNLPLGNYILHHLRDIENQIFVSLYSTNELLESKKIIQEELKIALEENNRLYLQLAELHDKFAKEQDLLHEQLDKSRREALAANQKIKSLKRDKHRPGLYLKNAVKSTLASS